MRQVILGDSGHYGITSREVLEAKRPLSEELAETFATRLAERGVGETARMALLGQLSKKMVRRHSRATPEAIWEAVRRLGQRAGEVLEFRRGAG